MRVASHNEALVGYIKSIRCKINNNRISIIHKDLRETNLSQTLHFKKCFAIDNLSSWHKRMANWIYDNGMRG